MTRSSAPRALSTELPGSQSPRLFDHQVAGIEWLRGRDRALLADEPGLGKSVQAILSAETPALIVAPAMILESGVWDDEIDKWAPGAHDGDFEQVAYSRMGVRGPRGRVGRDHNDFPIVPLRSELRKRYRTIICDEAHYVKGRKTWWTSCVQQLAAGDRMGGPPPMSFLTGTPIPNWAHEAFTLLQLMYPEKSRPGQEFGSYWRWVREWFHVGSHWADFDIGDILDPSEAGWARFRSENWGDRFLMRLRADCLDLPPLTIQPWYCKMPSNQAKAYNELKKDFVTWLDGGDYLEVAAWSTASQVVKLAKCATGLEILDPGVRGSAKLRVLEGILQDRPRQTLVVAHFQSSVEQAAKSAKKVGKKAMVVHGSVPMAQRKLAIRAFQQGDIDILCASIGTIREGLTLHQAGCDQVIRLERSYLPTRNEQVIRRIHRIGQERPTHVIDLITENTIDEGILQVLAQKTDHQMKALGLKGIRPFV